MAQQLHDRATRGMALSAGEQACLDQWYAQQDQEESTAITQMSPSQTVSELRAQVDTAVAQLSMVTQRIRALAAANEAVRQEIAVLHRRLAQKVDTQPA